MEGKTMRESLKKTAHMCMALAMCLSFASSPVEAATNERPKIALLMASLTTDFFVEINSSAKAYAEQNGIDLTVLTCDNDPARELANMEDIIGQAPDIILFTPTDSDAAVAAVEKANEAGIPVITFDRGVNGGKNVTHISSDNIAGGELAGNYIKSRFPGGAKVVELQGILATNIAQQRGKGFNDAIASAGNIDVVARQSANFDKSQGMTVMENILQAQDKIDAVFAHNDEMALGAMEACIAANRNDIAIVGFDASPNAVEAVRNGTMAATVAQLPAKIIQTTIDTAVKYLNGEQIPPEIGVGLELVSN
jgi:ribose transport system substrate-binding protein